MSKVIKIDISFEEVHHEGSTIIRFAKFPSVEACIIKDGEPFPVTPVGVDEVDYEVKTCVFPDGKLRRVAMKRSDNGLFEVLSKVACDDVKSMLKKNFDQGFKEGYETAISVLKNLNWL